MEVICDHCKTKLKIPDNKIPRDQLVKIHCPKCKNKITIDSQKAASEKGSKDDSFDETGKLRLNFIEPQKKEGPGRKEFEYEDYGSYEALAFFDEDVKLALALVGDDMGKYVKTAVEGLGYKCLGSPDTREALGKLRFHHFDIIILADGFDGQELEGGNPIINYINHMSMTSRRRIFLALISDKFKTLDDMMAYAMSANMVVNPKEADKLSTILKRGLSEHAKFYKVFMDTLVEVGKA
jgi:predicted Zn finger-like uncharacterized protein